MTTAVIKINTVSGTGYTIDVSMLELDTNVLIKDFTVSHNGVDRTSSYTKTSSTLITYSGATVTLGTVVMVERNTSLTSAETSFLSVTTASELSNALNKLRKRVEEADAYATYVSQQLALGGISIGTIPILDNAYGVSWDNDSLNAPSRNAVYDRLSVMPTNAEMNTALALKSNLASPTFTGAPLVPTPAYGTSDTQAVNRAYARGMIQAVWFDSFPATVLTTSFATVMNQTITASAGARFMMLSCFLRAYNPSGTSSVFEVNAVWNSVAVFNSISHTHASGTSMEQNTMTLPIYSPTVLTGANNIKIDIRALTAPSARIDQCTVYGFVVY